MMKKRKDFSSKSGVKFRFISNHVITFSCGWVWVYFWHYLFQQAYDLLSHFKF